MRRVEIKDPKPKRGTESEIIKCLVTYVEEGEGWGEFEVFRGSTWEKVVSVVPADDFSHALHGMVDPLLRSLGREPSSAIKRISLEEGDCLNKNQCIGWNPGYCKPGGSTGKGKHFKLGPPGCYEPPLLGATADIVGLFSEVTLALREGFYIVVIKGKGFNFA